MKQIGLWMTWLGMSLSALGQVTVEVTLPQEQFLPGEALPVAVRVTNRSGQKLALGDRDDWLTFSIESHDNVVIARSGEPPVTGAFSLESSQRATKRVDLAPYFSLTRPGRYSLVATVHIPEWDREITSKPKNIEIIPGVKLWEQEFGVPGTTNVGSPGPEVRKYILQQANHLRGEVRLYLRLTDVSGGKVFRVCPIGTLISFSRPEHQVDRLSNLHVLFATGPQTYTYTVFNPNGEVVERQLFDYVETRPRLLGDAEGKVTVAGGLRRAKPESSAAEPSVTPDDVSVPKS